MRKFFSIDFRSLGLFRITLGTVVTSWFWSRMWILEPFYSDDGFLSRTDHVASWSGDWFWSLNLLSGGVPFQFILAFLGFIAALSFTVGFRTKLSNLLTFILLLSFHHRNFLILNSGDVLMRLMLMWSLFLPLQKVWSLDRFMGRAPAAIEKTHTSIATTAVLLQIVIIYFTNFFLKTGAAWKSSFNASLQALQLNWFVREPLGTWMRAIPLELHQIGTASFVHLELIVPILLLFPKWKGYIRPVVLVLLLGIHLLFHFLFMVNFFSFVLLASLVLFIPTETWEWLAKRFKKRYAKISMYYDEDCSFCIASAGAAASAGVTTKGLSADKKAEQLSKEVDSFIVSDGRHFFTKFDAVLALVKPAPFGRLLSWIGHLAPVHWLGDKAYEFVSIRRKRIMKSAKPLETPKWIRATSTALCTVLFLMAVFLNLKATHSAWSPWIPGSPEDASEMQLVTPFTEIQRVITLEQKWAMFAPFPLTTSSWVTANGELKNGTLVDALNMKYVIEHTEAKQTVLPEGMQNDDWSKYFVDYVGGKQGKYVDYLSRYLCRRWNNRDIPDSEQLYSFELKVHKQTTQKDNTLSEPSIAHQYTWWCFGAPEEK